jgi:hypothetical protein
VSRCPSTAMAEEGGVALCGGEASSKTVRGRRCVQGIVVCGDKAMNAKLLVSSSVLVP